MTPFSPLLIFIIVRFICVIIKTVEQTNNTFTKKQQYVNYRSPVKRRYKMMKFLFRKKISNMSMLFNGHYIDARALYVFEMNNIPCVSFIGGIDVTRAFAYISENFGADIKHTYQHAYFDHAQGKSFSNNTIFVMANKRMIELGDNYCHVLHSRNDYRWPSNILAALADFKIVTQIQVIGFARQAEMN